jgi:hypothetical protein
MVSWAITGAALHWSREKKITADELADAVLPTVHAALRAGDRQNFMKAIGYYTTGAVDVLVDIDLPKPIPGPTDLLIEVRAISVNPVDAKSAPGAVRRSQR